MKFAIDGVEIIEEVVQSATLDALIAALPESVAGQRNLLRRCEAVLALAHSPEMRTLLIQLGSENARPVRGLFFDKNPTHNWKVPWHQDLAIAVAERRETPGFTNWSIKDGVPQDTESVHRFSRQEGTTCCVRRGGVVAMRPLVLHASSPAVTPSHRRVIHLEFSPDELPPEIARFEDSHALIS